MDLLPAEPDLLERALARRVYEVRRESLTRAQGQDTEITEEQRKTAALQVREATASTLTWVHGYTETFNPHWQDEGLSSPYLPFPDWPYFAPLFEYLDSTGKVAPVEKSRDMMVSWGIVAWFTLNAMLVPEREIGFQSMTDPKSKELVFYARTLWKRQPEWLREHFPLTKPLERQPASELAFANGSLIYAMAAGENKMRSDHPWGLFSDETAFQPYASASYNESLAACQKIVLNSTAAPSWYFDWLNDAEVAL